MKSIIFICLVVVGVGTFWSLDYLARRRGFAERTACVGSLIRMRLTKELYAEHHGLTNGAVIPDEVFWRENGAVEHCPAGNHYSINAVGVDPSCSYPVVVRWSGRLWRHVWPE